MFIEKRTKTTAVSPDEPVISTLNGKLRGSIRNGTYIFRGIKYADAKRFQLPTPIRPWEGIKEALVYGPVCPEIQTVQPDDNYIVPHVFYPQHEDCQYLNIWTQHPDKEAGRPVMVWLHGGGFSTGSGIEHFAYDGESMSRFGDVVVVTLNHRLNVLGFLDLSGYGEKYINSANVGMADIVEALRWIQCNIAYFGGNPDNVTVFGQSGGGGKVAALLQIPSAEGLFHKAIIQSGIISPGVPRESTLDMAGDLLKKLEVAPEQVDKLETMAYWRFQKALMDMGSHVHMNFGPQKDNEFYMGNILDVGICSHARNIPVIIGNVMGEFDQNFTVFCEEGSKNSWPEEKAKKLIWEKLGENTENAIQLFKEAYPQKRIQDLLFTDRMFRRGTFDYLRIRAQEGLTNTYGYMFAMEQPVYGGTLPWHNAEIPYVFHNADYIEASYIPGVTEALQDIVCRCWCKFAESGIPLAFGIPEWKPYTMDRHSMMYFDVESKVRSSDAEEKLTDMLARYPFQMKRRNRSSAAICFGGGPRVSHCVSSKI